MRTLGYALLLFALPGICSATVFTSSDVPVPILDETTVQSTITVPYGATITDVNVLIDTLYHGWTADLWITLTSPQGTSVILFNQLGSSGDDLIGTVFDDEATNPISSVEAPFTGTYRPYQPLSAFDGENSGGVWTLTIQDVGPDDIGSLQAWRLEVDGSQGIPEPSTFVLCALGLVLAPLIRRRK
jgi:subtilisin-like proprotein convertase family protein